MLKMYLLSLLLYFSGIAGASIDCISIELLSSSDTGLEIGLPTTPDCDDPTFIVKMRVHDSGLPYLPVPLIVSSPGAGVFAGEILGLESCTEYDILIEVYCDGDIEGGCYLAYPYKTTGCVEPPCEACVDAACFDIEEIVIYAVDGCDYEFVLPYAGDGCGPISIVSETWDFGHEGATNVSGLGSGYVIHSFPYDGTYTVTITMVYIIAGVEYTCCQSIDVTVAGCGEPPCETCIDQECLETDELEVFLVDGCDYTFVLPYHAGDCGTISIVSETWNFGHEGAYDVPSDLSGIGIHTFPSDGTYTVTFTFVYMADGVEYTCCQSIDVTVTGCSEPPCETCIDQECLETDELVVFLVDGCDYTFVLPYHAGDCGTISIVSETWNYGHYGAYSEPSDLSGIGIHTFPNDGTYTVTFTFVYMADGVEYTCCQSIDVIVTGCGDIDIFRLDNGRGMINSGGEEGYSLEISTVPNPADDQVTITVFDPKSNADSEQLELVIFDINSRVVYRSNIALNESLLVDLSLFNSGFYILEITNGVSILQKEKLIVK